jgi:hypothetical protein
MFCLSGAPLFEEIAKVTSASEIWLMLPSARANVFLEFGVWSFPGAWCLELGAWIFPFASKPPRNPTAYFVIGDTLKPIVRNAQRHIHSSIGANMFSIRKRQKRSHIPRRFTCPI